MADIEVPHFAFPLRVEPSGDFAYVGQDSVDDIAQCVAVLLATQRYSRAELPDYGIGDPTFSVGGVSPAEVTAQLAKYEPRADVAIDQAPDSADELIEIVRVQVERPG